MQAFATQVLARRFVQFVFGFIFAFIAIGQGTPAAGAPAETEHWVAAWAASAHGPYPLGNPTAQPETQFRSRTPRAARSTNRSA